MPKNKAKGSRHRKEAALEGKAMQHTEFVGGAAPQRAEAESAKHERLKTERAQDTVREMAAELEEMAGLKTRPAFQLPTSVEEGKRMLRELPDSLREKALERLEALPPRAKTALRFAESAAEMLLVPARVAVRIAGDFLRVPLALFKVLRHREA